MACACTKNKQARTEKRKAQSLQRQQVREQQLAKRKEKQDAPVQA